MPTSRCLTRAACAHAETISRLRKSIGDEKQWLAELGTALLMERVGGNEKEGSTGGASEGKYKYERLSGYIKTLPVREPDVVASWGDSRRIFLSGTDVHRALRDERGAAREEWERHVKKILVEKDAFANAKSATDELEFSFESYLDARSVVSSRAFFVTEEQGPGLVPIADLFNHRTGGHHVILRLVDDPRGADENKTLHAVVVASAKKGEEVFNTYGTLGNAVLLNSYGFTQRNNPADAVTFSVPDVRAAAALRGVDGRTVSTRIESCVASKPPPFRETSFFQLRIDAPPPSPLLVLLWAVTASEDAFAKVRGEVRRASAGQAPEAPDAPEETRADETTAAAATWSAAIERSFRETSPSGLQTPDALEVFLDILDRRRRAYVDPPSNDETWSSSLKTLIDSERGALRRHAEIAREKLARAANESGRRETCRIDRNADAFALFD